jgi:hypothetical protein
MSMLYFRSFPQGCYKTYEPHLVGLITDGSTGDFFPLEHAEILCSMTFRLYMLMHPTLFEFPYSMIVLIFPYSMIVLIRKLDS